ncbi:hypothetical protein Tco_0202752, partial [Tanacetum coccineum]
MAEILALRKEVALVKGDDERIAKLERLVNQIVVNQRKGGSSNDLMLIRQNTNETRWKQKVEEEKESEEVDEAELKKLLVIKKDEDIAIDAIPL